MKRIIVFLAGVLVAGSVGTAMGWTNGDGLLVPRAHQAPTPSPTPAADTIMQPAHSKRVIPVRPTPTPDPTVLPAPAPTDVPSFSPKPLPTHLPRPSFSPKPKPLPTARCGCGRWDTHQAQPDVMCPMIYCPDHTL